MARRKKKGIDPGTEPMGFMLPDVPVTIPRISDLPSWGGAARIGFDVETKDEDLRDMGPGVRRPGCRMVGFSFALEDGPDFYIPLSHEGGDNVEDPEQALRYLRDQAKTYAGEVVGMNLPYEIDWSAQYGVEWPAVSRWRDVQIGDVLLDELNQQYTLEAILERHAMAGKEEGALEQAAKAFGYHPKRDLWRLPARYVTAYGAADSRKPLSLARAIEAKLEAEGLWEAYDLECRVLPVLVAMRRRGIRVSMDRVEELERWSHQQEALACDEITRLTGRRMQVGECMNPSVIAPILAHVGVKPSLTATGKDSFDAETLGRGGRVGQLIIAARKLSKLRNTYTSNIRAYEVDGRIHATINQMARESDSGNGVIGARWGRMSSSNPNLQNQPARDEFAPRLRRCFLPEEGKLWGSHDFSKQEPKLIGHYAILCKARGWQEVDAAYKENPNLNSHQMMADLTGLPYKYAKNIFMGLCYGEGELKLCRECGFDIIEVTAREAATMRGWSSCKGNPDRMVQVAGPKGREVFDTFHSRAPFVRDLTERTSRAAAERGFVRLLDGRKCRFPLRKDGRAGYDWTHKALNRIIQGGAAVQTKRALLSVAEAGHYLQLAIHDDLTCSVESTEESQQICRTMENAVVLTVPTVVESKVGLSWGELE